ncbi:MAG TPA: hypothetical protein VHC19_06820 [Pirellulales bacterium]|jgi:hypothetical protein|nr:hypothetical protein [Pirellulales bacterium]
MQELRHATAVVSATVLDASKSRRLRKGTEAERFAERLARLVVRRTCGAVRGLRVEISPQGIALQGHCPAYYLKQLAQEAVLAVIADQPLFNQIEVRDAKPR